MNKRSTSPIWEMVSMSCSFPINPKPMLGPMIIPADIYKQVKAAALKNEQ